MSGHRLAALFSWRSAICDSDLSPTQRHVALTLSLHMNERGGSCFPSKATLANETGLSEATVKRSLGALAEAGWIVKTERSTKSGRSTSNEYQARVPGEGVTVSPTRGSHAQGEGLTVPPPEGVLEGDTKRASPPTPRERGEVVAAWEAQFDEFWAAYPRKVGKPAAKTKFKAAVTRKKVNPDDIMLGLSNWTRYWHADGTEERLIPHPSTWLNQERWNDNPPAPKGGKTMDLLGRASRGEIK